ncbi:MAG: hypothetical protein RLZZ292_1780 [Bacteroidota bacterium]|jgi:hypothetical protein
MAKTFGQRSKPKKELDFIGRGEHITIFNNNLQANEPIPFFNIYGQGGVGKSYLSNHYKTLTDANKVLSAYSDESLKSVLEWMAAVSEEFAAQKVELTDFDKRYKLFLQETKKLEIDPEKPKGTFGGLAKSLFSGLLKEARKIPGADLLGSFVNDDAVTGAIGEWAEFVGKKISNKDEVALRKLASNNCIR